MTLSTAARRILRLLASAGEFRLHRVTDRLQLAGYGYGVPVRAGDYEACEALICEGLAHCVALVDNYLVYTISQEGWNTACPQRADEWGTDAHEERFAWRTDSPLRLDPEAAWSQPLGPHPKYGEIVRCPVCGLPAVEQRGTHHGHYLHQGARWFCDMGRNLGQSNFGLGEG